MNTLPWAIRISLPLLLKSFVRNVVNSRTVGFHYCCIILPPLPLHIYIPVHLITDLLNDKTLIFVAWRTGLLNSHPVLLVFGIVRHKVALAVRVRVTLLAELCTRYRLCIGVFNKACQIRSQLRGGMYTYKNVNFQFVSLSYFFPTCLCAVATAVKAMCQ
jgi:hypothetical protein